VLQPVCNDTQRQSFGFYYGIVTTLPVSQHPWQVRDLGDLTTVFFMLDFYFHIVFLRIQKNSKIPITLSSPFPIPRNRFPAPSRPLMDISYLTRYGYIYPLLRSFHTESTHNKPEIIILCSTKTFKVFLRDSDKMSSGSNEVY
jgi:hypothetical protein